jgi:hypothetical protein
LWYSLRGAQCIVNSESQALDFLGAKLGVDGHDPLFDYFHIAIFGVWNVLVTQMFADIIDHSRFRVG